MCTQCVAQGVLYVGGAVGSLRVMAARAEAKRAGRSAAKSASAAKVATAVPREPSEQA